MAKVKSKIDKEQINKFRKASRRDSLIDSGFYNKPSHQVHKSSKDYTHKTKHKEGDLPKEE